jgi:hypothetical protein
MKLSELIQRLDDIRYEVGGDYPVLGAIQPDWCLLTNIDAITTVTDSGDRNGIYIGLSEGKHYGSREFYFDDFVTLDSDDEDEE